MIGGRKPCESAWKQSIITFPQVIGTYAAPSRGLHQLGSSFLPAFFPVPPKDLLFAVAGFGVLLRPLTLVLLLLSTKKGV